MALIPIYASVPETILSDRRVIEVPRLLWWIILNGIILNVRPRKSGMPMPAFGLMTLTDSLVVLPVCKRNTWQSFRNNDLITDYAMRYGQPSIHH